MDALNTRLIDAEALETALTKRISFWMTTDKAPNDFCQPIITALVDVRQAVREAAGINKNVNES